MTIYSISCKNLEGQEVNIGDWEDQVLLIVNISSLASATYEYESLQRIYDIYKDDGFSILAFPCDQFDEEEAGSEDQLIQVLKTHFGISFPIFAKIDVNGPQTHPLYDHLKKETRGEDVRDNFEKFLIDREGKVVSRFSTWDSMGEIIDDIDEFI